jgi:hypothetical protein
MPLETSFFIIHACNENRDMVLSDNMLDEIEQTVSETLSDR